MAKETQPVENHYAFLGLSIFAKPEDIQAAVDRRAEEAQELDASSPEAAQEIRDHLQRIQRDLLSGNKARAVYDEQLFAQETPEQPETPPSPGPQVLSPAAPPIVPAVLPPVSQPGPQAPPRRATTGLFQEGGPLWATAFILLGAVLAIGAVIILNHFVGISSTSTATPTPAGRLTPLPRTAPPTVPAATPIAPTGLLAQDRKIIQAHGFTPDEGLPASTPAGPGQSLYAWRATCSGSVDGHCQEVFFFAGARYLGTDTTNPSRLIVSVIATGAGSFAVTYANYRPQDHDCCPTGPPIKVVYTLHGSKMERRTTTNE